MDIEKQIDNYFKNWDKNSHGCLFTDQAVPVRLDTVKAVVKHFYELGRRTKYQQDRAEFAKLKAKEWQEGYDEGYAKGLNARKED